MIKTLTNQVIALAGLTQAVQSVQQVARRGTWDEVRARPCIASLFKIDADDVLDVYGGIDSLRPGLTLLDQQLAGPDKVEPELARYTATLLFLERKLIRSPERLKAIGDGIQAILGSLETHDLLDEDVLAQLAGLYQDTISEFKPRVIVVGEERFLRSSENAHRIRALLLSGIRAAVLWRQCGGNRWRLLWSRANLQREARRLVSP